MLLRGYGMAADFLEDASGIKTLSFTYVRHLFNQSSRRCTVVSFLFVFIIFSQSNNSPSRPAEETQKNCSEKVPRRLNGSPRLLHAFSVDNAKLFVIR